MKAACHGLRKPDQRGICVFACAHVALGFRAGAVNPAVSPLLTRVLVEVWPFEQYGE
ncbi:hypothetical protein BCAR13_60037 [Paraburkholderia caribensis]|nr:hypothetical protein BCAR13_60037 [Paraburkholderia caribensis]